MLAPEQVAAFRRDGTLCVPGLVPSPVLAGWRAQFWGACGCDPEDVSSWPGAFESTTLTTRAQASTNQPHNPLHPALGHLASVRAAVRDLGGGSFAEGQRPALTQEEKAAAGVALSLPREPIDHFLAHWGPDVLARHQSSEVAEATSRGDKLAQRRIWNQQPLRQFRLQDAGHIDGGNGNKGGWRGGFMLTAITYLDDIEPGGGGTNYWPGSHLLVHRHMLSHPDHYMTGHFENSWGVRAGKIDLSKTDPDGMCAGPREHTARAGDVLFMHAYTVHAPPAMNARPGTCRKALFARWHHPDHDQLMVGCGNAPREDLWAGWASAVSVNLATVAARL